MEIVSCFKRRRKKIWKIIEQNLRDLLNDSIFRYYPGRRGKSEEIMTGKSPNLPEGLLTRGAGKQLKQKNKNKKNPHEGSHAF